ncbi:type II secretion system secretin GspD [Defluviimonas salinarum]|uniref:Type II secretion system secretin GspD n=1 Tax=Defluviimonas salinarum TaxID=2992147 RepID=A0ABT3J780_9RHOB|nr:type II secretion system secretin GspD [Defluviimonas salinarum]MCW3783541.1 type II secretion system secretin GspD [Defluviimonas salinarum]
MTKLKLLTRGTGALLVMLLSLTACADGERQNPSRLLANRDNPSGSSAYQQFAEALSGRTADRRRLGTDAFMGAAGADRPLVDVTDGDEVTVNLVGVPIEQAAKAVLGDALGRNYTISPDVSGEVTLQTTRPVSKAALLETFQTILELNGATIEASGDLVTIVPSAGAARRVSRLGDAAAGSRVVAVPLQYVGTAEMTRLLEPIAGSSVTLQPIPARNILLVSGNRSEINAAIDAVNLFDVDVLEGKSVGLFKLNAAEPEALVAELNVVFETAEGGSLQNVVSFVPSKRLGAVLVVTSRARYLAEAERWIRELDGAAGGIKRRPVVYALQNRAAKDLAPILTEMIADVESDENNPVTGRPRIVADETQNAVVVWGNDTEQSDFARLIQTLDTTPVQVLLEATIAEVSLNDELNFGLRWFFENGQLRGTFSDASNGAVSSSFPGLSFTFQGASAGVALNALASITDVDVVSSPSLVVLDNQEARLQIGDEVPIATQQVQDTGNPNAPIVNTISFRDTGIILTVRPRVSESGRVIMDIEQEVSSVSSTTTSGIDSPTISTRKIKTSVAMSDGQTIALGGLIEDGRNRTNSQVPGAGKVPVVGALFRNRSDKINRRELLVLITPRVIRNGAEAESITAELRQRLKGANGLVGSGVTDPGTGHRIID